MDIFGDEKYKQLDWLTQAVEPITWKVADRLLTMPASYTVTIDDIKNIVKDNGGSARIDVSTIFHIMLRNNKINLPDDEYREICDCYKVVVPTDGVKVNLEDNTMSGQVELLKTKDHFSEEELQTKIGLLGMSYFRNMYSSNCPPEAAERIDEVLDLMGIKSRKHKLSRRLSDIKAGYENIMKNNQWKIRNVELSNKVAKWIHDYIITGNYAAFTNFCKVKAITHRGYPIYSIEEET